DLQPKDHHHPSLYPHQVNQRHHPDPDDVEGVPEQAEAQQAPQHGGMQSLGDDLRHHIDEPDETSADVRAVHADQSEEGGQEGAAGGSGALVYHAHEFRDLEGEKRRAEHERGNGKNQEAFWFALLGGERPEPTGIARDQQTHGHQEDVTNVEQVGAGRSAGGIAGQDRIGGEQRRKHDDVAEDEDPEPVGDDDSLGGRSDLAL